MPLPINVGLFSRYPNGWYKDVTSSHRFYSLAATLNNEIIGVIIAEIKDRKRCNKEVKINEIILNLAGRAYCDFGLEHFKKILLKNSKVIK